MAGHTQCATRLEIRSAQRQPRLAARNVIDGRNLPPGLERYLSAEIGGFDIGLTTGCPHWTKCPSCAVATHSALRKYSKIDDNVLDRIGQTFGPLVGTRTVALHRWNEFAVYLFREHDWFLQTIHKLREYMPEANLTLHSNGDVFATLERSGRRLDVVEKIFDAGLSNLIITAYDTPPREHKQLMKLNTPGNKRIHRLVFERDVVPHDRTGIGQTQVAEGTACFELSEALVCEPDGALELCCNGIPGTSSEIGNIMEKSWVEIWFSPEVRKLRRQIELGRRVAAGDRCADCDNRAAQMPGASGYHRDGFTSDPPPAKRFHSIQQRAQQRKSGTLFGR